MTITAPQTPSMGTKTLKSPASPLVQRQFDGVLQRLEKVLRKKG